MLSQKSRVCGLKDHDGACIEDVAALPNLKVVPECMFSGCFALVNTSLHNSITSIGPYAFSNTSVKEFVLPHQVTQVQDGTFSGCTALTSITFSNETMTIGKYAFAGCSGLQSIILPATVISIDTEAFRQCTSLAEVVLSRALVHIGIGAFQFCTSLTAIAIPATLTKISAYTFQGELSPLRLFRIDNSYILLFLLLVCRNPCCKKV